MHNIEFHLKLDIKHGYLIKYFEEIIVLGKLLCTPGVP